MDERADEVDAYLAEQVREALVRDRRVGELGVEVTVDDKTVVLTGLVTSEERGEAAAAVVGELLPGHAIRNETTATELSAPADAEHLP